MVNTKDDDFSAARMLVEILEGFDPQARRRILRWAAEKLGNGPGAEPVEAERQHPADGPDRANAASLDYDHLIEQAAHLNDRQFAAAVAYAQKFLAPSGFTKDSISSHELRAAARRVRRAGPKHLGQTMINAEADGLLQKVDRGSYSLTRKGKAIVEAIATSGTAGVRVAESRKSTKIGPKFRDPQDPAKIWSGRGRQPRWVRAALSRGLNLEQLRVSQPGE